MSNEVLNFEDTQIAFAHKSNSDLKKARMLFKSFNYRWLLSIGPGAASIAIKLGFKQVIKNTIFEQFCGGETIEECEKTIQLLQNRKVGTILDYSVEGEDSEDNFEQTANEIIKTIERAAGNDTIPFSVFKTTGIGSMLLLEKVSSGKFLNHDDEAEYTKLRARFEKICKTAFTNNVRLFVDAEETWIQPAIDALAESMMLKFNLSKPIIYNTIQLYRWDRLSYLKTQINETKCYLGFKLVRGAYMEKEAQRARENNYKNPIQPSKAACDSDYNAAIELCIKNIERVSICVGTHNEKSSQYCLQLMAEYGISNNDKRIFFSQLFGMSDHISFNLSQKEYNVAKYLPYGPVWAVIPYLTRRAQENTSVAGQAGRELGLIHKELKRRNIGV